MRGEGKGKEETRSGKILMKGALIGCSKMHAKAPRACLHLDCINVSFAHGAKNTPKKFYRDKKCKVTLSDLN